MRDPRNITEAPLGTALPIPHPHPQQPEPKIETFAHLLGGGPGPLASAPALSGVQMEKKLRPAWREAGCCLDSYSTLQTRTKA